MQNVFPVIDDDGTDEFLDKMIAQTVGPLNNDTSNEMIAETVGPLSNDTSIAEIVGLPSNDTSHEMIAETTGRSNCTFTSNKMDTPEMLIVLPEDKPSDKSNSICSVSFSSP